MQFHTTPIAEPIGLIAGVIGGRVGSYLGKELFGDSGLPAIIGVFGGATLGHYLSSVITKGIINALGLDVAGLATNAAITSPATSLVDGILSSLNEAFPGALDSDTMKSLLDEAMAEPQVASALSEMGLAGNSTGDPRFGGLAHSEMIAGQQVGPECGIHAVGNMAQFNNPGIGEEVNDWLKQVAASEGGLVPVETGTALNLGHYEQLLEGYFQTPVHWEVFDPNRIQFFLEQDHAILAVGDAHFLNPSVYSPGSLHAFNIVDSFYDNYGALWYSGLDSNFPASVQYWPASSIQHAVANTPYAADVLITDSPARWPAKT